MSLNGNPWLPEKWAAQVLELVLADEVVTTTPIDFEDVFQASDSVVQVQGQSVLLNHLVCTDRYVDVGKGSLEPDWTADEFILGTAAELLDSLRRMIQSASKDMKPGHHAVLVCRPWAPISMGSRDVGRWTVSGGGLSLTMHASYDMNKKRVLFSLDMLVKVIVVEDEAEEAPIMVIGGERANIFAEIEFERGYQDGRWGTEFDDKNTANDWVTYITHYATKAAPLTLDVENFEEQMMKVAALAVAAIEVSRRNGGPAPRHYDQGV